MADDKANFERFIAEVFNKGNMGVLDELVDDAFAEHEEFPGAPPGKEGLRVFTTTMRQAFPDLEFSTVKVVQADDEVWAQFVVRGTHQGDFMGVPATGRKVEIPAIDRVRFAGGKIVEHWGVTDVMGMMQQLGVVPEGPGA